MNKALIIIFILIIGLPVFFNATPLGVELKNSWFHSVQTSHDDTFYRTKREVEDTCRAMIASYESDKFTYEQFKDSTNETKMMWAEQAKMRANKTASSYNNYILKNKYIWKNNIPNDIQYTLKYIR